MVVNIKSFSVARTGWTTHIRVQHIDNVLRINIHPYIHRNSGFLVVTITVGLDQAPPNYVHDKKKLSIHEETITIMHADQLL